MRRRRAGEASTRHANAANCGDLGHAHPANFKGAALLALKNVEVAGLAFRLYSEKAHFALAFWANHQGFDDALYGPLRHPRTMRLGFKISERRLRLLAEFG